MDDILPKDDTQVKIKKKKKKLLINIKHVMIIMFDKYFKWISLTHLSSCIQKYIYFSDQVFSSVFSFE